MGVLAKLWPREPLWQFLLLGAALFGAYHLVAPRAGEAPGQIFVSRSQVDSLAQAFTRTWQRPPTRQELDGLIRSHVREEVFFREALALGMEKDDSVVRRRLRQKVEFLSEDLAEPAEPSQAQLQRYLAEHPAAFRTEAQIAFRQVYLDPQRHGDALARDAATMLASLEAGADADVLGDSTLMPRRVPAQSTSEIAARFDPEFAARLAQLPPGRWHGPIRSGFGQHLVLVTERKPAHLPELSAVRDAVRREWRNSERVAANERLFRRLLARYTVTVEGLPPPKVSGGLAQASR